MVKIKTIAINNFVGVEERIYEPGNLNVFEGNKGSGKTTILEGIEVSLSNNKRRSEIIKHGTDEAKLFVELDNGMEIERRIRDKKTDYLKIKQDGKAIKSTEAELRKFLSGNVFRPLDFIDAKPSEQTATILNMIQMNYSDEEIIEWFGNDEILKGINTNKHLLQILKEIETNNFSLRTDINREIKSLEAEIVSTKNSLPENYNGNDWRDVKLQEHYNKITEAQNINSWIDKAKTVLENTETEKGMITSDEENSCLKIDSRYKEQEQDTRDIIEISKNKIEKSKLFINDSTRLIDQELSKIDFELEKEIQKLKQEFESKKDSKKKEIEMEIKDQEELISIQKQKIASKESEILGLDEKKAIEKDNIKKESQNKIIEFDTKVNKAKKYLEEHKEIDIQVLQAEADNVASMQEYIREYDKMITNVTELANKKSCADSFTKIISIARNKPFELLKQCKLPIDGISIDENSMIRINETLLDGLSNGEKFDTAFKIALQEIGDLRIMCLDGFEKLNKSEQAKVIKICDENDIQAFITITKETENGISIIRDGERL